MAIIKGWFDDSRRDQIWAVGGYAGADRRWEYFDREWPKALARHGVPYFHMKEMASPTGIYAKWHPTADHAAEIKEFLSDLASVIGESRLVAFLSLVRLRDLARFNKETRASLQPYPLAAYGCMLVVGKEYGDLTSQLFFDHLEKVDSKLAAARRYADSDSYYAGSFDEMITVPLARGCTARKLYALQAADFIVWEFRKHHEKLSEWFDLPDLPRDDDARAAHMQAWSQEKFRSPMPPPRKSIEALVKGNQLSPFIWDYGRLCEAHERRGGKWS
jgi:hypothetical protein